MSALYFLSGFIYNLFSLFIEGIPMSISAGYVCVDAKKPIWKIDELEFLEGLDKEHQK